MHVCICGKRGILEALQWQAGHRDEEIMAKREEVIAALEFAAEEQRSSGLLEAWFDGADQHVREVGVYLGLVAVVVRMLCVAGGWRISATVDGPAGNCHRALRQRVCAILAARRPLHLPARE